MADKTVRIGVDSTEAKNLQNSFRQSSENLARDMIKSSRAYSSSSKEVLKDVESQIRAIEKRNKLDQEFQKARVESLRGKEGFEAQYTQGKARITKEAREDQLQTRLLREIVDTIKSTSKEEIRSDRKGVEKRIQSSKTVGRLGVKGDEFESLKETVQQDILTGISGKEATQKGGGMAGIAKILPGGLGRFAGMATPVAIAAIVAGVGRFVWSANQEMISGTRGYAIAAQMPAGAALEARNIFGGTKGFAEMGMKGTETLDFYSNILKATGGRQSSPEEVRGLAGITRSRNISPDLLNQTLGFQRYSSSGNLVSVISSLEGTLKAQSTNEKEFRRKLIQLPEMLNVYNSMASQMLQTTGSVNQNALSTFVSGVGAEFGVEGVNLQRYATNLQKGFMGSQNNFLRKMQFGAVRKAYGDRSYQETLEVLEDPTSNPEYMQEMFRTMKQLDAGGRVSPAFRSWMTGMGFGAKESRKIWESGSISDIFKQGQAKTLPSQEETLKKYSDEAARYYGQAEQISKVIGEFWEWTKTFAAEQLEPTIKGGVKKAITESREMKPFSPMGMSTF